jgi:hypothetical protein
MWAGVHFPSANADGLKLGRTVAKEVLKRLGGGAVPSKKVSALATEGRR